jgi:LmbE family N-acetylglucosaminyl deacetylase
MQHIIISPHLDDAVGGCGGTMARMAHVGDTVVIFNMFCAPAEPPYPPFATHLHVNLWGNPPNVVRLRRAEDEAAAARLGAVAHFEGVQDSLYRKDAQGEWMYGQEGEIFGPRHPDDDWLVPYLVRRVTLFSEARGSRIYAPLGVGHHLDHVIGYEVGVALSRMGFDVLFYEELSYSRQGENYRRRIQALVDWSPEVITFDEACLEAKIDAFGYYRSQIRMIFGDPDTMRQQFTEAARSLAPTSVAGAAVGGERYWRPPRSS